MSPFAFLMDGEIFQCMMIRKTCYAVRLLSSLIRSDSRIDCSVNSTFLVSPSSSPVLSLTRPDPRHPSPPSSPNSYLYRSLFLLCTVQSAVCVANPAPPYINHDVLFLAWPRLHVQFSCYRPLSRRRRQQTLRPATQAPVPYLTTTIAPRAIGDGQEGCSEGS